MIYDVCQVAKSILERNSEGNMEGGSIVLNATAEFCRTLGDIPTYGLAGNRDEDAQELLVSITQSPADTFTLGKDRLDTICCSSAFTCYNRDCSISSIPR
jgi:hypothetical protein